MLMVVLSGCDVERRKTDTELGLNPQQAAGRRVYDAECGRCHEPYSARGKKGPGLKGVFQNKYLSLSGLPANDERVGEIIRMGRKEMPGYSQKLSPQDLESLLAYMHTL
jgi:mono/diheme cytochrome c family protein